MAAPPDSLSPQALKARFEEVRLAKAAARNHCVAAAAIALLLYGLVRVNVTETASLPGVGLGVDPVLAAVYGPTLLCVLALRGCGLIRLARSEAAALRDAERGHGGGRPIWIDAVRDLSRREGSHPRFRGETWGWDLVLQTALLPWRWMTGTGSKSCEAAKRAWSRTFHVDPWRSLTWNIVRSLFLAFAGPETLTLLATLLVAWGLYVSDFRSLTPDWRNQHTARRAGFILETCGPPPPREDDQFYVRSGEGVRVVDPWRLSGRRGRYARPLEAIWNLPRPLAMTRSRMLDRELREVLAAAGEYERTRKTSELPAERDADDLSQSVTVSPWYTIALPVLLLVSSVIYCWTILITLAAWEAETL